MELKEYKRSISQPIPGESAVGERLVDDPLFDFVEDQMMKVGSLSHADVQWDEVEHSVVKLLAEKSKDIKLLTYLLQCLHHQASPARFILSFELMASFMSQYWKIASQHRVSVGICLVESSLAKWHSDFRWR